MLENINLDTIPVGSSVRRDCPLCGGTQTLSISRAVGKVLFHCFRSSCRNNFPSVKDSYTIKDLQEGLKLARTEELPIFELPLWLRPPSSSKKAISMLSDFNCMKPYHDKVFDSYYDPKEDRLCILLKDNLDNTIGMVGRTLNNAYPKVKVYDNSNLYATVFRAQIVLERLVLVEDVFSAISVTNIPQYAGYPLLGTRLSKEHCNFLAEHYPQTKLIVALDRDARAKMKKMVTTLRAYGLDASELELTKDIKNLTTDELSEILQPNLGD